MRLFRTPIWCPSGGGDTQEEGETVAESLVYRVNTHQIWRAWRAARSSTSQGSEPLRARSKGANQDVSEGKLIPDHGLFFSTRANKERTTDKIRGAFLKDAQGLDDWMLARAPALPAHGLHHHGPRCFSFLHFCITCGLEKLGLC